MGIWICIFVRTCNVVLRHNATGGATFATFFFVTSLSLHFCHLCSDPLPEYFRVSLVTDADSTWQVALAMRT